MPPARLGAARAALAALGLAGTLTVTTALPASAVVGGSDTSATRYPWLAAVGSPLFFLRPSGQFCGGELISSDRLLTAAHCIALLRGLPQSLTVTFGRSDLAGHDGTTVGVTKIWVHPGFHETTFKGETVEHNDIAVLTLARPQTRPTVRLADSSVFRTGKSGTVLGWGTVSENDFLNAKLKTAKVPLVPDAVCAKAYGSSFDRRDMTCAGSPAADTCLFDSGGPLLVDGKLAGLTSWAYGCARPGYPGVYTRVPSLAGTLP